ncbi:MAG: tetratricopeptide repeat protein [candidate division WOR-3 bacterium]|nr:tetratricopeptide repeat protein [candidate division WOR-3 bacterium]
MNEYDKNLQTDEFTSDSNSLSKVFATRLQKIIIQNDVELIEYAKNYQKHLQNFIRISYSNSKSVWTCPLFYNEGVLVRYHRCEFDNIDSFQKHLEILRAEAEAILIHNKLGFCSISESEKEYYTKRALGILPETAADQFREIVIFNAFKKYRDLKELLLNVQDIQTLGLCISKSYGESLALIFFLLLHSGVDVTNEFKYYGQKLDFIFNKLISSPELREVFDGRTYDNTFHSRYVLLTKLREVIDKKFPRRVKNNNVISFATFLENVVSNIHEIEASEFLFAALDSFLLSKFGFDTEFVIIDNKIHVEIILPERVLYWDPIHNTSLNYQKLIIKYRGNYQLIIAFILAQTAQYYFQFKKELERAVVYYKNAICLFQNYPDFYKELAQIYLKNNQFKLAIDTIKHGLEIFPDDASFYYFLGVAYYMNKELELAVINFRRAISMRPNYVEALNNLAICYTEMQKYDQALIIYQQLQKIAPDYFLVFYGIGNIYYALKNYYQAVIYYQRAISLNPKSEESLYNLAQTYYELGEVDKSIKTYKKLIQIAPNHARAWYNLGVIYRDKGMKKEAVKCLERAIKLNPNLLR